MIHIDIDIFTGFLIQEVFCYLWFTASLFSLILCKQAPSFFCFLLSGVIIYCALPPISVDLVPNQLTSPEIDYDGEWFSLNFLCAPWYSPFTLQSLHISFSLIFLSSHFCSFCSILASWCFFVLSRIIFQ